MEYPAPSQEAGQRAGHRHIQHGVRYNIRYELIVLLFAAIIYLGSCISPPALMDDVDAVQAQIARNMLESGDWVTARLDGVPYLEKSPLIYWLMAIAMRIFGTHDWAVRLPLALSVLALCWLTVRMGTWAFSAEAGFYAGLTMATCIGLYLFTRIQIPDAMLTGTIALALWSFLRALDEEEHRPKLWAFVMAASIATGLLLKGLIAALFPSAAAFLYLVWTGQLLRARTWKRIRPFSGLLTLLLIAAPWHVLATLQNPPLFDWTMKSEPGRYHGFFWFYFLNEHVFRFLNIRYPRDYNTVPRPLFWGLHLLWLFPWSVYFPALVTLRYSGTDRASRMRLLAVCWTGFLLVFFTFSTTQEYYSMPCYPALALLLGCAMASPGPLVHMGSRVLLAISALAALTIGAVLFYVRQFPAIGDISQALTQNPDAYTLSLGHMGDLTLRSFAYLRVPLAIALCAMLIGIAANFRFRQTWTYAGTAAMMTAFLVAARFALVVFDPYLGSRELAEALNRSKPGTLIVDDQYYTFSSIFFYTDRIAYLLNGRVNNLEYGSNAPGAPAVFLDDAGFTRRWSGPERYYLVAEAPSVKRLRELAGPEFYEVQSAGGKSLFTNHADLR